MAITITSADDLLSVLASLPSDMWFDVLADQPLKRLQQAADLCGVGDSQTLTKSQAINSVRDNF